MWEMTKNKTVFFTDRLHMLISRESTPEMRGRGLLLFLLPAWYEFKMATASYLVHWHGFLFLYDVRFVPRFPNVLFWLKSEVVVFDKYQSDRNQRRNLVAIAAFGRHQNKKQIEKRTQQIYHLHQCVHQCLQLIELRSMKCWRTPVLYPILFLPKRYTWWVLLLYCVGAKFLTSCLATSLSSKFCFLASECARRRSLWLCCWHHKTVSFEDSNSVFPGVDDWCLDKVLSLGPTKRQVEEHSETVTSNFAVGYVWNASSPGKTQKSLFRGPFVRGPTDVVTKKKFAVVIFPS